MKTTSCALRTNMAVHKIKKTTPRKKISSSVRHRPFVQRTVPHRASWAFFAPVRQFLKILRMVFFQPFPIERPHAGSEKQVKKLRPIHGVKTKRTPRKKGFYPLLLQRFRGNPVLAPLARGHWESKATFNPSAVYRKGKVHLVYRAIGTNDVSSIGYATSKNGFSFTSRSPYPVFTERQRAQQNVTAGPPLSYLSGGGWK